MKTGIERVCIQCQATYHAARLQSRFCTKECRMAHKQKMRDEHQVEVARLSTQRFKSIDGFAEKLDLNEESRFDPRGFFVYVLWGADPDNPIYVGQSSNVFLRIGTHFYGKAGAAGIHDVQLIRCSSKFEMCRLEVSLIRKYRPVLNVEFNEDDIVSDIALQQFS